MLFYVFFTTYCDNGDVAVRKLLYKSTPRHYFLGPHITKFQCITCAWAWQSPCVEICCSEDEGSPLLRQGLRGFSGAFLSHPQSDIPWLFQHENFLIQDSRTWMIWDIPWYPTWKLPYAWSQASADGLCVRRQARQAAVAGDVCVFLVTKYVLV